jgi:hypothetical protein
MKQNKKEGQKYYVQNISGKIRKQKIGKEDKNKEWGKKPQG